MRKAQKKQAEDFVALLLQANNEIRMAMEQNNFQMALKLMEDCKDGAISLKTYIEKFEGKTTTIVPFLNEYYELVCLFFAQTRKKQAVDIDRTYDELRYSLIKVDSKIKSDIKVRLEVVFLPYKVSMWDSLESIWKAADEDPDCDTYVIPIPYYDKTSEGGFAKMHYEADLYPDDVRVLWYGDYNFERRKPDIIFIHNPYDDYNYVTSVHPFFYSKNLKNYTEKLVYVPYFISNEILPENMAVIEQMKHLYLSPGVFNSDRVFVQSENIRQIYINVLAESTRKKERRYWETRILGLGSPKLDKLLNTEKKDLTIPKDWLEIIENPDGSRKKVVLYNTSVGEMLQDSERMIRKIWSVLQTFKKKQHEVVLLWRPHPLMEATLQSMRPQLWKAYRGIVEWYCGKSNMGENVKSGDGREHGYPWGIYDDSGDLHRAVRLSSAYIGDPSSVVTLYQKTGKPILLLKVNPMHLEIHNVVCEDGYIFFCFHQLDMIFKMELQSGKIEHIGNLPPANTYLADSYLLAEKVGEEIFLLKSWSDSGLELLTFNQSSRQSISYKITPIEGIKQYAFRRMIYYQNKLFLMPYCYPAIVEFDLNLREFKYYLIEPGNSQPFSAKGYGALLHENLIYLPCHNPNAMLVFNCDTGEYTLDLRFPRCNALCYDGKNFWIVGNDCNVYKYNKIHESIEKQNQFPISANKDMIFYNVKCFGNYIVFSPECESIIYKLDINNGETTELKLPQKNNQNKYFIISSDGDDLLIFSRERGSILKYHVLRDVYEEIELNFPQTILDEMALSRVQTYEKDNSILIEDRVLTLVYFLNRLEEIGEKDPVNWEKPKSDAGKKIYKYMKDCVENS